MLNSETKSAFSLLFDSNAPPNNAFVLGFFYYRNRKRRIFPVNNQNQPTKNQDRLHKVLTVLGTVLCVILIPILIVNCTLLVKSFIHKDEVPDFGGTLPLIVLTDSMYPNIKSGDLIICRTIEAADVQKGDVISFYDPAGNGTTVVTHKVIEIIEKDGVRSFRTQGINNNTADRLAVPAEKVIARYTGIRVPFAGNIAIFMQSTAGLIVCVVLPILLFVGYDVIRRRNYERTKGDDMAALMKELEELRSLQNAQRAAQDDTKGEE